MASILLQLHKLFDAWPDEMVSFILVLLAVVIIIIAVVPEQKMLRMVTLAYIALP